jgi:precorrin-6B methylase 2
VAGAAPAALAGLGAFDAIFVGGSGGDLAAILAALPGLLRSAGRLVCNTVCLETTATVTATLRRPPWASFACSQVAVARGVAAGPSLRFEALNPVWLSSARLAEAGDGGQGTGESGTSAAPPQAAQTAPGGAR